MAASEVTDAVAGAAGLRDDGADGSATLLDQVAAQLEQQEGCWFSTTPSTWLRQLPRSSPAC